MQNLSTRIIRRTQRYKRDFSGAIDVKRFLRRYPGFKEYDEHVRSLELRLKPAYARYIEDISTKYMAVSLETAFFLYIAAKIKGATQILDLGSGFSSYVLGLYSSNTGSNVFVHTVDDNDLWLDKTKSFLLENGMPIDRISTWADFHQNNRTRYDLIFHDLGDMQTRMETLPFVLNLLSEGGIVVLDDMHKKEYSQYARAEARNAGFSLFSMSRYTLDELGRFSEIAIDE
ncbi:MAG: class I SAM-dependent methyltransferase [Chloroflexi bacterium]|nr:class I SAM-dependent methyltransferase [Chloroflexota bacterium]